jgi:post-segregation antitoxin (ccd killing protein)
MTHTGKVEAMISDPTTGIQEANKRKRRKLWQKEIQTTPARQAIHLAAGAVTDRNN